MIEAQKRDQIGFDILSSRATSALQEDHSSLLKTMSVGCLMVMLVLLPVERFNLPFNVAAVDVWNVIALPIFWLYLLNKHRSIHLPYVIPMWLILLGALIGSFAADDRLTSLVVVV